MTNGNKNALDSLIGSVSCEISTITDDLATRSHDASIFEVVPQAVVFPKNTAELQQLVTFASSNKKVYPELSLTARSGGTDMSGGSLNDSIVVDFTKYFNHIKNLERQLLETEPGVYYRDIETLTLKHNLIMPSYPASKMICTIGGMVANNSGGEKSLRYGQTKDYVQELRAVLSDGNEYTFKALSQAELDDKMKQEDFEGRVYRDVFTLLEKNYDAVKRAKPTTSKNSSGYFLWDVWDKKCFDLTKLLTGSQGTLGLITNIKLRLIRPQPKSELLVMFLNDTTILGDLVHTVMQFGPETFESYDKHTLDLAVKFLPDMLKAMKGSIFKLAWGFLPEVWMTITGGIPALVLIAEFTGATESGIAETLERVRTKVEADFKVKTHVTNSAEETQKYWTIRRESFNLLRKHSSGLVTAPFIDDIIVHPEDLPRFLPELNAVFAEYPHLIYTIAGHAGNGNFHIIPLMDLKKPEERAIIPVFSHKVYDLVLKYRGSITAEHNDGLIRTPYLEKMYGPEIVKLFAAVKHIFDPQNIFNPRKKVGGTEQYALEHIKH